MDAKFLSPYKSEETEARIYEMWLQGGFFNPDNLPQTHTEPFAVVLPPPNVTGVLHLGHALENSLQDAVVRYKRMRGYKTLWIPGTDHAAIATETKVEKELNKKTGKSRHDLGRDAFLAEVKKFAAESHDTIIRQIKRMGSSLDWSREAYTLDEQRGLAVRTAFKRMYDAGLIYRGKRIINWDPKMQTTVSDDEIEYVEEKAPFYYFTYGPFTIGTVRPETKFGDKYVVMHPDDKRYSQYEHGEKIEVEWINGPIQAMVIKDASIDMEFGSGVMTITPAHSHIDFELAQKYTLDVEPIIDERGILLPIAGEFAGMHIKKARPAIIEKMRAKGLIEKVDEQYVHNIATNSRGGGIIEPQLKLQWFVNVNKPIAERGGKTLKELMRAPVESGAITIKPDRFEKIYYHWIDNLRDWCISRQIWFGHRLPVWYHEPKCVPREGHAEDAAKCVDTIIVSEKPTCEFCDAEFVQDPDTLDTWFSSALWTFSTLGWPEDTKDFKTFHPTAFMGPGYEILFFWVARMILMSQFLLGEIPFHTVYLHGILRDKKGQKFSKSLGTGVDPIEMINKYGADALRMSLVVGIGPGNDANFDEQKVLAYKKFANKLWNIARFVLTAAPDGGSVKEPPLNERDREILAELDTVAKDLVLDMDNYRFYLAGEKIYHYIWHTFADKILEESKPRLSGDDQADKRSTQLMLFRLLETSLVLLHPFMPFITEEIWGSLPDRKQPLIITPYVH